MSNIPKLRFKEFNDEWKNDKINNLFYITAGGDLNKELFSLTKSEDYIYPVYSNSISQNGLFGYYKTFKHPNNRITVTARGTLGITFFRNESFTPIGRLLVLESKNNMNCDMIFFKELLNHTVKIINEETGVPQLTAPSYGKYNVNYPSLPEQEKIASFLSLVDEKIELQEQKVESLKKYKKGMMQKIFSQEIRFKDENGEDYPEWEEKKLGNLIEQKSTRNKKNKVNLVLSINNNKGFIPQSEQFENRVVASSDVSNYKIVNQNDFAYNPARINVGSIARLKEINQGIISPMYVCFKCNNYINYIFLEIYLNTYQFKTQMEVRLEGSVRKTLSYEALSSIKIKLPYLPEQEKIASFLSTVDEKIELEQEKLKQLQEYKKGLLQQMFV